MENVNQKTAPAESTQTAPAEGAAAAPVKKKEKLTWAERRRRWKQAKAEKRRREREYYRYAPWYVKAWHFWLRKTLIVLAVVAVCLAVFGPQMIGGMLTDYVMDARARTLTDKEREQIYVMSPRDEEGAARIDALPAVGEKETWAMYVYLVGADLEDDRENDLSYVTRMLTRDARDAAAAARTSNRLGMLSRFNDELKANGLELPAFYYNPQVPVPSDEEPDQDDKVATRDGCASTDIGEMTADVWSDNISVVIQAGGATHWTNQMINPNRTQRFLYKNGSFDEVSNLPLQKATDPETLAEFLRFCDKEYPADHRILVLWDHGAGAFGYAMDSIYGDSFSLKDVRKALTSVYGTEGGKAPFDIIGFDACLMSTLEVTHALSGFADYYCLSEESEPGDGWDYTPLLKTMSENPTMSPAKVAMTIADTYTDYYMGLNAKLNIDFVRALIGNDVTFSVIDAKKADELYGAYCELAEAQLRDAVKDIGVLSEIGRCGSKATRFGGAYYNVFGSVDLGNYVDYMIDSYPEACSKIKDLVGEAVLYHRENGSLSDATGIAVYLPTMINDINSLIYYLDYVYNISDDDSVKSLYYYKQAGCLNDELKEYVAGLTKVHPQVLDVQRLREFSKNKPELDSEGFRIPVDEKLQSMITDYRMEISRLSEEEQTLTYYGRDERVYLDGEGHLCSDFDGKWVSMGGVPLSVEIISSTPTSILYRSPVKYDGVQSWLEFSCDRDTEVFTITGIREMLDANDDLNYFVNAREIKTVEVGSSIIPLYDQSNLKTNSISKAEGERIRFSPRTQIKREALPDDYYLCTAVISDQRGDSYYSAVVSATMKNDKIENWAIDPRFIGRDY